MFDKKTLIHVFPLWFPFAVLATLLCFLIYIIEQQNLRIGANDPQIQLAEDAAFSLGMGKSLNEIFSGGNIDMVQSLAPYVIVYNNEGKILQSSVTLHGKDPVLPAGVFKDAINRELRFTWQPELGVRHAAIVVPFNGVAKGYVLAGRSLKEVEKRENNLGLKIFAAWIATLVLIYASIIIAVPLLKIRTHHTEHK